MDMKKFSPIKILGLMQLKAMTPEERKRYYDYHKTLNQDLGLPEAQSHDVRQKDPKVVDKMSRKEWVAYMMDLRYPPEKKLSKEEKRQKQQQIREYQRSGKQEHRQMIRDEYFSRNKHPAWIIHWILVEKLYIGRIIPVSMLLLGYILGSIFLPKDTYKRFEKFLLLNRLNPIRVILNEEGDMARLEMIDAKVSHFPKYDKNYYRISKFFGHKNHVPEPGNIKPYQSKEDMNWINGHVHAVSDHYDRNAKLWKKPKDTA